MIENMDKFDEGQLAIQHILRASILLHTYLDKIPEDVELNDVDTGYAHLYIGYLP
jgi:hypothetical protein